jgi:TonB family protein
MASGPSIQEIQGDATLSAHAPGHVPAGAGLVVLTRDEALVHALKALGSQYPILTARTESDLAGHLMSQGAGVAILDVGTVPTPVDRLSERLRAQFPELVLIVAGGVDDQSALATQITNGTVYRFLHKPVSDQRVRLFVEAAWRRHLEEHSGSGTPIAAKALTPRVQPRSGTNILLLGGAVVAALALAGGWRRLHPPAAQPAQVAAVTQPASQENLRDTVLEDLLTRADAALVAGSLVSPQGTSAADFYRQAQRRRPTDPRGASGIEKVIDRLLSNAEAQLLAQHLEEAQRLTDQARAIKPDHVRVAFLMAQIGKERERAVLEQAREAAASGHIEEALSTLDGAGPRSTLITEARQELEQQKLGERVRDYVSRANDRMRGGQLLEPAQDNARFYIESARTLAPEDAEVKQAHRQFLERLVNEAHKALTAGNADQGEQWIQAASEAGVSTDAIAALKAEAEHVRSTARTDALARLALLVNERLAQGKVLDPSSDSAKYYLAQLVQADPTFPSTQTARQAFATRTLDEAKSAARRQDYAGAQRWLTEARDAGVDQASISAVNAEMQAAQQAAQQAAKQANEFVSAASLELTHYVAPQFPLAARKSALSGWVDVQFIVNADGSVSDLSVIGAEPVGVFEQPATDAVRKWRYRPTLRDGQPITQRARVRVRFALEK